MSIDLLPDLRPARVAWNKGRFIGQKRPLLPRHVWSIRVRLGMAGNAREIALFNMAVGSKLRGCDLVGIRVTDVFAGSESLSAIRKGYCDTAPDFSGCVAPVETVLPPSKGIRQFDAACGLNLLTRKRLPEFPAKAWSVRLADWSSGR